MVDIIINQGPFELRARRTPTGGVLLLQHRTPTAAPHDEQGVYVPPQLVRDLALTLARIAAERIG